MTIKLNKEQKKALEEAKQATQAASKELDEMAMVHEIAIKEVCEDKEGNKVQVLVIDLDKPGYIGKFMELGNPYKLGATGEPEENGKKLMEYLIFMANVDLTDPTVEKAVGSKAIMKARGIVSDFFLLNLVSGLSDRLEQVES